MELTRWCNRIIRWGFYFLFILVPLVLTPWNFELFEYNKMMLTYGITAVIAGAWIVKMISEREIRIARTPLDVPIALFVASQLISSLFSIDPHVSWWGYYSRFNGGMWSVIAYTVLYYAFVTNFTIIREARLLRVAVTTAAVIAIYGVLEHFGVDKNLWVQDVQSRVFSTLGQPNWLAAYLVALTPFAMALGISKVNVSSVFYLLSSVLFFVVLLWTRSRSGYLGLAVADIAFWFFVWLKSKDFKKILLPVTALHLIFAVFVFTNGVYVEQIDRWATWQGWTRKQTAVKPAAAPSGTAIEFGGTESGTIRKYVWQGAINAWKGSVKNMLVGTGTETFAFAFYQYRPAGHNLTSEWDFLYNKAHNEYLNYLATTGLFGLTAYLIFIAAFIIWFLRYQRKNNALLPAALFSGWLSILVTNFFGFSVVIIQLMFFLIPAMTVVFAEKQTMWVKKIRPLPYVSFAVLLTLLIVLGILVRFWQADTQYALGNRLGRSGLFARAQAADAQAIALNPREPVYRDDMAAILSSMALSAAQDKNATLAAQLARRSIAESDRAIAISPNNVNFWKTRTKVFYTLSVLDPTLNSTAIAALEKAAALSPNDPKIYYNLAILYGREANTDKALELLKKAKMLKRDYRDAYFGLYVFYTDAKKPELAKQELTDYLTNVNPQDREFQDRLKQ